MNELEHVAGAAKALFSAGPSVADAASGLAAFARADIRNVPPAHACTAEGCVADATHQTTRAATEQEAEAYWTALEQNIRESGTPEYVQDRTDTVTVAVHLCDHPDHADPLYLEAKAREATPDAEAGRRIHDYTRRHWGHDFTLTPHADPVAADITGWGHGLREHDFLLIPHHAGGNCIYEIETLRWASNVDDMWSTTCRFVPGSSELGRRIKAAAEKPPVSALVVLGEFGRWWVLEDAMPEASKAAADA